jgi:hypothetical protein
MKTLLGIRFGKLTVIERKGTKNKTSYWLCRCDCGKELIVERQWLQRRKNASCGCGKSLVGQRFGRLVVSEQAIDSEKYPKGHGSYWICVCDCGETVVRRRDFLVGKGSNSCGCLQRGPTSTNWRGHHDLSGSFFSHYKSCAKRRGIGFDVSIEYLWGLFLKQDSKCALTGETIALPTNRNDFIKGVKTASLDRIDSSIGYVSGNVQWVHKDIQFMKYVFDQNYFIEMCKKVALKAG